MLVVAVYCTAVNAARGPVTILAGARRPEHPRCVERCIDGTLEDAVARVMAEIETLISESDRPPISVGVAGTDQALVQALMDAGATSSTLIMSRQRLQKALDYFDVKRTTLEFAPPSSLDASFFARCAEGKDPRTPVIAQRLQQERDNIDLSTYSEVYVLFSYMIRHIRK